MRYDPVNSDCREKQRDRCEDTDEKHIKPPRRDRFVQVIFHSLDTVKWQVFIERAHFAAYCRDQRHWPGIRADDQRLVLSGSLGIRQIKLRFHRVFEAEMLHVADDADNLALARLSVVNYDAAAERVHACEASTGKGFVNDDHA